MRPSMRNAATRTIAVIRGAWRNQKLSIAAAAEKTSSVRSGPESEQNIPKALAMGAAAQEDVPNAEQSRPLMSWHIGS